jgi:hypothetical protein
MSKLQEYLYDQYSLILLGSEIDDILALARQEIELPSGNDIEDEFPVLEYKTNAGKEFLDDYDKWAQNDRKARENQLKQEGAVWALMKVRNPYPKPM